MSDNRLRDIKKQNKPLPIQIRVIKKWILSGNKQQLCYLFIDMHGDAIEAFADLNDQAYFDSIIRLQSCYTVTGYVTIENKTYMPTVNHTACLKIGKRADFKPLPNANIPCRYFCFAAYDELDKYMTTQKPLADYIAYVENNTTRITKKNLVLRKVDLRDLSNNTIQLTLWPEKYHLIGNETVPGDIVAIKSAAVTQNEGLKQLQSTFLTEIFLNPTFPEIQEHVTRLKELCAITKTQMIQNSITLQEALQLSPSSNTVACSARIKEIQAYRKWYYVQCSKCTKTLHLEQGDTMYYVCVDDNNIHPVFMYCINATLIDPTAKADVVLYNEVMTSILGISCEDMIVKRGYSDPTIVPPEILAQIGVPRIFKLIMKPGQSTTVSSVSSPTDDFQPEPITQAVTPATPTPTSKRARPESPDTPDKRRK